MDRNEVVLTAFAAGGENATFSPVQTQKLFFLLDEEADHLLDGPHFQFEPYDYGPFDRDVYAVLNALSLRGLVVININGRYRNYALTPAGYARGRAKLNELGAPVSRFLSETASWVRSRNFQQLVSAIYHKYPDMKVNSVFKT